MIFKIIKHYCSNETHDVKSFFNTNQEQLHITRSELEGNLTNDCNLFDSNGDLYNVG